MWAKATTTLALIGAMLAPAAHAALYSVSYTGVVTSSNACANPGAQTGCYVSNGDTVTGSFIYTTGTPGLSVPTQAFYRNLITDYTFSLPGISYSGHDAAAAGFGRFVLSRNATSQASATASTFSAYVARNAGNYTFLGGTNTVAFTPPVPTIAANPADDVYGDLAIEDIRVNFGALTSIFADLSVPTTFTFADLDPSVTNFAVGLASDFFLGNQAAYSFGGGLTSVTVTPMAVEAPEPFTAGMLLTGLLALAGIRCQVQANGVAR